MTGNQPLPLPRAGRTLLPVAALLSAGLAGGTQAAEWTPHRTVELVVGAGAGGPLDVTARTIQRIWRERGIVTANTAVLNRPGAGGALGFKYLNDNGGDGHHLAVTSTTLLTNGITGTSTIRYTDLTPVAILFSEHVAFGVRADSGMKTADDLVRTLRAAPGSITISIASVLGNHNHLGAAALTKKAGGNVRDLKIVVNKSSGESVTVLLGGHVDAVAATASNFVAHVETGKIRILAVAAPSRLGGALSQVPTFREQGHDVVVGAWRGVVGPGKMSAAQLAYWEQAFAQLVRSADWKAELDKRYFQDAFKGHRETAQFLATEHAELRTLLTEVGLAR
jgi:putative tricarboxylic transport membrane protein